MEILSAHSLNFYHRLITIKDNSHNEGIWSPISSLHPGLNFIKSPGERCFGTLKQIVQWYVKQRIYTKRELTGDDTWWKQRDQITVITHWDNHCHPLPFTVENGLHYLENQLLYTCVQWPKNLVFYSGSFLTFLTTEIILFYKKYS